MFKYLIILSGFAIPAMLHGQAGREAPAAESNIDSLTIRFCANYHCDGTPVTGVDVTLRLAYPGNDTVTITEQAMGCRDFGPYLAPLSYTLLAEKNEQPLNGLNALDLHRIVMHVLAIAPLPAPFNQIAADANRSFGVTTFDLVQFSRLMQGITDTIPNNQAWRFIDQDYIFPDPNNPFSGMLPEIITVPDLSGQTDSIVSHFFTAIKVGDVDCSAIPGFQNNGNEERAPARIRIPAMEISAGETVAIPVYLETAGPYVALQAELGFDPGVLEILEILPGTLPGETSPVTLRTGRINLLWYGEEALRSGDRAEVCRLQVRARRDMSTREVIHLDGGRIPAQAFSDRSEQYPLLLSFDDDTFSARAYPNPGSENCSIQLSTLSTGKASLRIFSPLGALLFERSFNAPVMDIPAEIFPCTGVYPFEIRQDGKAIKGRIVRI